VLLVWGWKKMRHFAKHVRNRARSSKHSDYWIDELLTNKVHEILQIEGEHSVLIRTALLAGLGKEQLLQLHKAQVCSLSFIYCNCSRLHYSLHHNDMIFLSGPERSDSNTRCFAVMPHVLWQRFRAVESIGSQLEGANKALEQTGTLSSFDELAQVFLDVHFRSNVDFFLPQYLDSTSVYDAAQTAICSIINRYCLGWERQGLVLNFE
jgi:hypothetical protein